MTKTFQSIKAFDRALAAVERDYRRRATLASLEAARLAEKIAVTEVRRDVGGDTRMSGWDRDLADLVVKPLRGSTAGAMLHPTRKSGGPWKVVEIGRNQGNALGRGGTAIFLGPSINRKTGQTARTKTGKVARRRFRRRQWNGYTSGFGTASRAVSKFEDAAAKSHDKNLRKVLVRRFDVKGF